MSWEIIPISLFLKNKLCIILNLDVRYNLLMKPSKSGIFIVKCFSIMNSISLIDMGLL